MVVDKIAQGTLSALLLGESGVGKEAIAHDVHKPSPPFVIVHCAAMPENLLESTLFGHKKGAFTGADQGRAGRREAAEVGTVFFDEIGAVSLSVQPKLLRALEDPTVTRDLQRYSWPGNVRGCRSGLQRGALRRQLPVGPERLLRIVCERGER